MAKSIDELLANIQPMSMAELERTQDGAVWAINNTKPLGPILIELKNGVGGNETVNIPGSWCPFDVTTICMKKDLLETPTFRRLVAMKSILIVPVALAEEILATPEAGEEQQKLYSKNNVGIVLNTPDGSAAVDVENAPNENVSPIASMLVEQNKDDEKAMLQALRNAAGSLSDTDFQYIAENAQFPKIKEFCANKVLAKRAKK